MPTSPTGNQHGFTLIEVMLVILILGLTAGLVSFSLPDRTDTQLAREANRLKALLALVQERAIYRNRDYGLQLGGTGYRFVQYSDGAWGPPDHQPRLAPRTLPAPLRLSLAIEAQPVELPDTPAGPPERPQILILGDGQLSEFDLTLAAPENPAQLHLRGRFTGELSLDDGATE